jgi:hypothetical protein
MAVLFFNTKIKCMRRLLPLHTCCHPPAFAPRGWFLSRALIFLFLGFGSFGFAASGKVAGSISGTVTSAEGSPLSGVTVSLKGTAIAVTTDNAGAFTIDIPGDPARAVLIFSSVGYVSREVPASGVSPLRVVL